jgi:DNA-binding PadR family transcriptional regulator
LTKNLSPTDVKRYILAFLYKRDDWFNLNTIQQKAIPTSQDANRVKAILEELCAKLYLESKTIETGGSSKRKLYKITEKGRKLLEFCRNPIIGDFFNDSIENL